MRWRKFAVCAWCWLIAAVSVSCERKAPNPEQCQRFALIALGIRDPRVLSIQPYRQHFEELTWKCLTTPYDRKLIRCTEVTGQPRYCLLEFDQRRREQLAR